jgi:hypothetical protein
LSTTTPRQGTEMRTRKIEIEMPQDFADRQRLVDLLQQQGDLAHSLARNYLIHDQDKQDQRNLGDALHGIAKTIKWAPR